MPGIVLGPLSNARRHSVSRCQGGVAPGITLRQACIQLFSADFSVFDGLLKKNFCFLSECKVKNDIIAVRLFPCGRGRTKKTRIHHQHISLGEELPGLHCKGMNKTAYDKTFFEIMFSSVRMRPYFDRYSGDEKKALRHYRQNIQLAEALLPSLSIYEVALRNSLIRELERMTGRKDWYTCFSTVPAMKALDIQVDAAKQHIVKRRELVTSDKINGELTMGFWVLLFNAKYERYLWKDLRKAFPYMPKSKRQRKYVSAPLNDIRTLRNRVFHNESISWSLTRLEDLHGSILEVCSWINPRLPLWIKTVERFSKVVLSIKRSWYGWWKVIF